MKKREALARIINAILSRNPQLHYYQGFHDIASVFLLVCGEHEAFAIMEQLSLFHIRDALNPSLASTQLMLSLLFPLIKIADLELYHYLMRSNVQPYFALSWVLTWFSHGFDSLEIIARLFDVFIASHPLMPLYIGAIIIVSVRTKLLNQVECEYSMVHTYLSNISQNLPWEIIIQQAVNLQLRYPPNTLLMTVLGKSTTSFPLAWKNSVYRKVDSFWIKLWHHLIVCVKKLLSTENVICFTVLSIICLLIYVVFSM